VYSEEGVGGGVDGVARSSPTAACYGWQKRLGKCGLRSPQGRPYRISIFVTRQASC
jgi:hypothetical protein